MSIISKIKVIFEDFECLNQIQNGSLPADRLQKIGCSLVTFYAIELNYMSKDGKLQYQSVDIRTRSIACISMVLNPYSGTYKLAIPDFCV